MTENKWLRSILGFKLAILMIYLTSHSCVNGDRLITLSSKNLTDIYSIVKESDSAKHEKGLVVSRIVTYLENSFDHVILTNLQTTLRNYAINEFPTVLSSIKIRVRSFFWLTGNLQAVEIVFWSVLGVLASLLYHGSEAIRKKEFDNDEITVHIAKVFYAPACAVIIIFSINALTSSGDASIEEFQYWLIILSFILGFFSGRTIELLDKIKDLLLPLGKSTGGSDNEQKATQSQPEESQGASPFTQHSLKEQDDIIRRYLDKHGEEWKKAFPELTGISSGKKQIQNSPIDLMAIVFQVTNKTDVIDRKLPGVVEFEGYHIPTDVQEHSKTVPLFTRKVLEDGVSRINDSEFGTMGVPVVDDQKQIFILSCFHVLFNQELRKGIRKVNSHNPVSNTAVVSPSTKHGGTLADLVGDVIEGEINNWIDFAVFKPKDKDILNTNFLKLPGPFGVNVLSRLDENKTYVQFWGRGSGRVVAMPVLNIFSNQWIEYTINDQVHAHYMKGLIQLGKPANAGDSGAAVFDAAGNFVGLIVGSDNKSAYMISYTSIALNTKYKIKIL